MKRVDSFHLLKERFGKWSKDPSPLFSADMFTPTYVGRRCVSASRRVVHKEYFFYWGESFRFEKKGGWWNFLSLILALQSIKSVFLLLQDIPPSLAQSWGASGLPYSLFGP